MDARAWDGGAVASLQCRIAELEVEHRRLLRRSRGTWMALGVLVVVPMVTAFSRWVGAPEEILVVRGVDIVDATGVKRIELRGGPEVTDPPFYGRRFRRHGSLGASILFYDAGGAEQGGFLIPDRGGISMGMDSKANQVISISAAADGRSMGLDFYTTAGEPHRASLGITPEGPHLRLVRNGVVVVELPGGAGGVAR
jgi:hypothetical protein